MKKEAVVFFACVIIGGAIIIPYGMHRNPPPQQLNFQSGPPVPFVLPKTEPVQAPLTQENNAHAEFSDATDPSGLGHLFFGQIIAIGYGSNMHVDDNLKILVVGALADEVGGQITPESIKNAYKKSTIMSIENGNTLWEGRKLPAALTIVDISMVNRIAGKYDHVCIKFLGILDKEFDIIRAPMYIFCDKDKDEQQANYWKKEVNFETISNYQFNKG
jgi:hypothetical protein